MRSAISNNLLLQFGYASKVPRGQQILFSLSYNTFCICNISVVNVGYVFVNIMEITNTYVVPEMRNGGGSSVTQDVMYIAIGY